MFLTPIREVADAEQENLIVNNTKKGTKGKELRGEGEERE
jgi:hypothetical protein